MKKSATLTPPAMNVLIIMAGLMAMVMIVANLAATKIWSLLGTPVDGGILLFPVAYILGDLLVEIYGQRIADNVAWGSCWAGVLTILVIFLTKLLPDYPGADNSGFVMISAATGRIFVASLVGFIVSQILNNDVFAKLRRKDSGFWKSAFLSSVLAHIPDILLFEPIAFWGKLSVMDFIRQAVFAYVVAIVIELALLTGITQHLAHFLVKYLKFQHGEPI